MTKTRGGDTFKKKGKNNRLKIINKKNYNQNTLIFGMKHFYDTPNTLIEFH